MFKKSLLLCLMVLLLSSCAERDDYQYLTTHPKFLERMIKSCETEPATTTSQAQTCNTAEKAKQEVSHLLHNLMSSPQQFGKDIIAAQQILAAYKAAYKKHPSKANAEKVFKQQKLIARYLAISKFVGE